MAAGKKYVSKLLKNKTQKKLMELTKEIIRLLDEKDTRLKHLNPTELQKPQP